MPKAPGLHLERGPEESSQRSQLTRQLCARTPLNSLPVKTSPKGCDQFATFFAPRFRAAYKLEHARAMQAQAFRAGVD